MQSQGYWQQCLNLKELLWVGQKERMSNVLDVELSTPQNYNLEDKPYLLTYKKQCIA